MAREVEVSRVKVMFYMMSLFILRKGELDEVFERGKVNSIRHC